MELKNLDNPKILLEINNSAIPEVNELSLARARWLIENSVLAKQILIEGQAVGIIIALDEQAGLDSDYYRWFGERYHRFIYIDRVVIADWARGNGLAGQLYREVEKVAEAKGLPIASEVYSNPPNLPSLNFHQKMGYQVVGEQYCAYEGKTVSKLMKYPEKAIRRDNR